MPALLLAHNWTKNAPTVYSPYFLPSGREPRLPIEVEFGLQKDNQKVLPSKFHYIENLRRRLKYAQRRAQKLDCKQQESHMGLYNPRCRGAEMEVVVGFSYANSLQRET